MALTTLLQDPFGISLSLPLLVGLLAAEFILLQRPWDSHANCDNNPCHKCTRQVRRNHLWICCRTSFSERTFLPSNEDATDNTPGRLPSLKKATYDRLRILMQE